MRNVDGLATACYKAGAKKCNKIGFLLGNQPDYLIAYYAAIKLGMIIILIKPLCMVREM
ncbi:hypothetical protein ACWF7H_17945 [Peribacillus butanolivorans]